MKYVKPSLRGPLPAEIKGVEQTAGKGFRLTNIAAVDGVVKLKLEGEAAGIKNGKRVHHHASNVGIVHAVGDKWSILTTNVATSVHVLTCERDLRHQTVLQVPGVHDAVKYVGHSNLVGHEELVFGEVV